MTYNNGTKFMAACKFGDSLRNLCGDPAGVCTAGQEGDVEYNTGGSVLRYCNGSNWVNVQCQSLGSCVGTAAGTISADATQMKYCNGTTWQAMYNDGICTGIGVQEATFSPSNATDGEDAVQFTHPNGLAMTDAYMMAGSMLGSRNRLRDGAVTVYKRSGTTWTRLKELVPTGNGVAHYFGNAVAMDGDYAIVGAYGGSRVHFFKKDHGGADNWGELVMRGGSTYSGIAVDLDGDQAIAGAHGADGAATNQGNARIYRRDSGGADAWGQVVILTHPGTPVISDNLGNSVAIAADMAAIGGPNVDDSGVANTGVIWLYQETSLDNWVMLKKFTNPNGLGSSDYFGSSVDLKDLDNDGTADRMVIGAYADDEGGSNKGTVFVYERNQGGANNWGLVKQIDDTASPATSQYLGFSTVLGGDRVISGIILDDTQGSNAGASVVFGKDVGGANNWGVEQFLYGSLSSANDQQGRVVAMDESGTYATMGSMYEGERGAAYTYSRSGSTWTQRQRTQPHSGIEHSVRMGDAVAASGDYAATGIIYKTDYWVANKWTVVGGVDIYKRAPDATWSLDKHVLPPSPANSMQFGQTLDISPEYLVVGVPGDDTGGGDSGGAMLFGRNVGGAGNWGFSKLIKHDYAAGSQDAGAENGIALFGEYIVLGVGGDNRSLVYPQGSAGSVAIFKKDQGGADNWGQIKKVVPTVEEHAAYFGRSVDLAGTTLVAGAARENANGTDAGAIYIYERDQGGADNWGLIKRMTGESASDHYGWEVAVSGDTMAIGAPYDDDAGTDRGAVYIYYRDNGGSGNWGLEKKMVYDGASSGNALFGRALDLSGDILIIGAPYDDTNVTDGGYTYVYSRNEGGNDNWGLLATIDPNVPGVEDLFGFSVAVSGNVVAAGGIYNDDAGVDDGAIYVFGCPPVP